MPLKKLGQSLQEYMKEHDSVRYYKGDVIQSSDERQAVCLVKSGFIKRYLITNDGSLSVQSIYGPGNIYPLTLVFRALFDQSIYGGQETYYYEAMTNADIYSISAEDLITLARNDSLVYKDLLREAGKRFHSNIQQLENISLKTANRRMAHQLAYLATQFGQKGLLGTIIRPDFTHQDLANILSITRETASFAIIDLRQKGLIKTKKHIIVPDIQKLLEFAYS